MLLTLSSNVYHSLENTIFSGIFDWKSHLLQKMDRDKQKSWLTWQTLHVTIGAPPVTDVYGGGSSSTVPCTIPPGPTVRETESSGPTESSKKIHIIVNFKNLRHFLLFIIWKKEKKRYVWVILPLITADVDGPYRLVPFESNPESPPSPLWFINGVVSPECISSDWVQSVLNSFEYPPSAPRFLLFVLRLYWHLSWIYFVLTTSVYSSQRVLVQTSSDWLFHSFTDYDT